MDYILMFFTFLLVILICLKIYAKATVGWDQSYTSLIGKTVIVTGANSGIGYSTALEFAKRGGRVILACRNEEKANKARDKIIKETDNPNVIVKLVDMSSFASVRRFAEDINNTEEKLDILVNNAGVGSIKNRLTKDGFQVTLQVNYFSSFLLTHLLIDLLKKSAPSRIINVASIAATQAKIDPNDLNKYVNLANVYANSKLCNIFFTQELAKKLAGTGVTTYSLHPGVVLTDIFRRVKGISKTVFMFFAKIYFKTPEEGAQTTIYTALTKNIEDLSGEHFSDCKRIKPYKVALNPALAKKVWEKTDELVQLTPNERCI